MRRCVLAMSIWFLVTSAPASAQESCTTVADCADLDGDLIRDDNCVWWDCIDGSCVGTDVHFADLGSCYSCPCGPSGSVDGGDWGLNLFVCFNATAPAKATGRRR